MITTHSHPSHGPEADRDVPLACFGERGMDRRSDHAPRTPMAAGLFGLTADCAAGVADVAAIMARSAKTVA